MRKRKPHSIQGSAIRSYRYVDAGAGPVFVLVKNERQKSLWSGKRSSAFCENFYPNIYTASHKEEIRKLSDNPIRQYFWEVEFSLREMKAGLLLQNAMHFSA